MYITKEIELGKKIGGQYEMLHTEADWPVDHPVIRSIPRGTQAEYELRFTFGDVPFLGFIDSLDLEKKSILELKTGRKTSPWTQARVNRHDQLVVYYAGVKELLGECNPYTKLVWLPTHELQSSDVIDGLEFPKSELMLTGESEVFTRCIQHNEVIAYRNIVQQVAREISEDWTIWSKLHPIDNYEQEV